MLAIIVDWPSRVFASSCARVSLNHAGDEPLARLYIRRGSAPGTNDAHGAVINEAFADANSAAPGGEMRVILNGRVQSFGITGIALSPEYVYAVKPGVPISDDRFFAIFVSTAARPKPPLT